MSSSEEADKNGDGEDRIRDLTHINKVHAKRALYQLSYVPLVKNCQLVFIRSPERVRYNSFHVGRIRMLQRRDTCFYSLKYSA